MNVARVVNVGRGLFLDLDGCFNVCKESLCLIGFRVGMLGGKTATFGYSVNPTKSAEAYRATFNGPQAAFHQVFQGLKLCDSTACLFCRNIEDICEEEGMKDYICSKE